MIAYAYKVVHLQIPHLHTCVCVHKRTCDCSRACNAVASTFQCVRLLFATGSGHRAWDLHRLWGQHMR